MFSIFACSALLVGLIGCKEVDPPKPHVAQVVDYRNKTEDGTVISRSVSARDTAGTEFEYSFIHEDHNLDLYSFYKVVIRDGGSLYVEDDFKAEAAGYGEESKAKVEAFASNVVITNHPDGFQLEFTTPEGFDDINLWSLQYIDGTGNKSTGVLKDGAIENGKLTVVYPLVKPGKEAKFWVQLAGVADEYARKWEAQLYYSVTPVNGLGCVDDVQKDYDPTDYAEIVDGSILRISKVIPPMAKNLQRSVLLFEQDTNNEPYGEGSNVNGIGGIQFENATEEEVKACEAGEAIEFDIDLKKYMESSDSYGWCIDLELSKNKPYIWVFFSWSYTLEDFPGYTFGTPQIQTKVVPNTEFKTN